MEKEQFTFKKLSVMTGREAFCVMRLRTDTFVTEQEFTVPELDDDDLNAIHVYLLNKEQTTAVAVCRIFQEDGRWMLGRVAVSKQLRGQHLGSKMMEQVHQYVQAQGADKLYCHAQMQAKPFYDSVGYVVDGEIFQEGGVDHVMMVKQLG